MVGTAAKPVISCSSKSWMIRPPGAEAGLEHERRAEPDAAQQLVEAVAEGERQHAEDAVGCLACRGTRLIESATKAMLPWVSVTPFGSPVEPDV